MQHNLLSPFEDANAPYVTNKTVLIIIFINIRMIYRYSCLTNHFQDVTKQGPLLLRRHLPTSLLIRVQTSLQQHVHIFIWHLIHFCHFRFPDFSNPLKSLQTPRCNTLNSLARLQACCFGAAEMVVLSSRRPAVLLHLGCQSLSRPKTSSSFSAPFWREIRMDSAKEALEPHCDVCYTYKWDSIDETDTSIDETPLRWTSP